MTTGTINNCIKCGASYGQYGKEKFNEYWCCGSRIEEGKIKEAKGLCQFCNPNTAYTI